MKIVFTIFVLICVSVSVFMVHIVQTKSGVKIYTKREPELLNTYADLRNVSLCDLRAYESVVHVMILHGDTRFLNGGNYLDMAIDLNTAIQPNVNPEKIINRACSMYNLALKYKSNSEKTRVLLDRTKEKIKIIGSKLKGLFQQ